MASKSGLTTQKVVNYIKEKKDLIKKIDVDKNFLVNSIILVNKKDLSSLKKKTDKFIHSNNDQEIFVCGTESFFFSENRMFLFMCMDLHLD